MDGEDQDDGPVVFAQAAVAMVTVPLVLDLVRLFTSVIDLVCCDANMDEAEVAGEEGETFGVRITLTDGLDGVDPAPAWLAEPVDGLRTELRWSVVADGVTYALDPDERGAQEETGGDR